MDFAAFRGRRSADEGGKSGRDFGDLYWRVDGEARNQRSDGRRDEGEQTRVVGRGSGWADNEKYTGNYKNADKDIGQKVHYVGNNIKAMHVSVEDSLKKLRTSYIDIFYVHWWDYATSIEEVMNGLHHLVVQGKVLYLVREYKFS